MPIKYNVMKAPAYLLLLLLFTVTTGCQKQVADELDDYTIRVARVLEQDIVTFKTNPLPYQTAQDNAITIKGQSINLLEFLKLNKCKLGQAVAKGNSALGKVAAPSQKMHVNRDFLRYAPECIELLKEEDPELSETLNLAYEEKRNQRMAIWWNAWTGHKEWQGFSSTATSAIEMEMESPYLWQSLKSLDYAIEQGKQWQTQNWQYNETQMEEMLKQLLFSESLGRWLHSMVLLEKTLIETAQVLEARFKRKALCSVTQDKRQSDILFNVFRKYYAGKVQPYLSKVHRFGEELSLKLETLNGLIRRQAVPDSYHNWHENILNIKTNFDAANKRHVKAWQTTLRTCNLMPAAPIQ